MSGLEDLVASLTELRAERPLEFTPERIRSIYGALHRHAAQAVVELSPTAFEDPLKSIVAECATISDETATILREWPLGHVQPALRAAVRELGIIMNLAPGVTVAWHREMQDLIKAAFPPYDELEEPEVGDIQAAWRVSVEGRA